MDSVKRLLVHKEFMKLVLAYGLNVGVFNAFSTLLNQIILGYFPVRIHLRSEANTVFMAT